MKSAGTNAEKRTGDKVSYVSRHSRKPFVVRSPYSTIIKLSIRSKCFLFSVANGKLFATAVAAINKSAVSISLRFTFSSLFRLTATLATALSKGKTSFFEEGYPRNQFVPAKHQYKFHIPLQQKCGKYILLSYQGK